MGVESGPSGGVGGVGTAVSIGPAISPAGIEAGLTARFGLSISAESFVPSSPIVNEGLLPSSLAGFKPIGVEEITSPTVGGVFKSELNTTDVLLEAESILLQARQHPGGSLREASVIQGTAQSYLRGELSEPIKAEVPAVFQSGLWVEYIPIPVNKPAVRPDIDIASESEIKTENTLVTQPVVENRTSPKINLVSPVKALQEQLVEEVVEKVDRTKALHVIDKKGVVKRIVHTVGVLVGALQIKKGAKEKRLPIGIKGSEVVAQLLPSNKSEIRGGEINSKDPEEKLPDKTWDATLERLEQLEFATKEQIIWQVPKIVEENHPVTLAIEGEVASEKNILRSHEYIKGSSHAYLESACS